MSELRDHPIVEWCERTGYPSFAQPIEHFCEKCGDELGDEYYESYPYEQLCKYCLLDMHRKEF